MKGRKPIFRPECLKVGEKIRLNRKNKDFAHQYAYMFRKRLPDMNFKKVVDGKEIFIERVS